MMLQRAITAAYRSCGGFSRAVALPYVRCMSSATGTAGKSSATGTAATSGDRVNEQEVKAVADKAGAAGGKIAGAKSAGRPRKHLPHTGTEGAAPWSAATAGSDPTSIGRGEAAGSAERGGNIDQNVRFSEEQGQGGSLRGGVASARAAATPSPDQADLIDYDNVGPDVATANEQQQQGSAAAPAAGGKTGKSSRKSSRAQDAAASVGGNIGQPMGPVVSSAGVRRGGGAAGGGGSGSGAGGGAGGVRSYHTAAPAFVGEGSEGIPAADQRERGAPVANTSNATLWEREDVGRSRLLGGAHIESSDGDTPSLHRDPSNNAVPFRPADERSDRDFGVLTEDPATHEPRFLQQGEMQPPALDIADPDIMREALDVEAVSGERRWRRSSPAPART